MGRDSPEPMTLGSWCINTPWWDATEARVLQVSTHDKPIVHLASQ